MTSSDTPATSADPETLAEGDTDQLEKEDMLLERGVDDLADEGWVPPDRPSPHRLETELENYQGDTLDERLAQEEPEVWETPDAPAAGSREPDRAGRLAADAPDVTGSSTTSLMATDAGVAGGAASAEEAAMHVVDDDDLR